MGKVASRSHLKQLVLWLIMIIELLVFLSVCSAQIPYRKILKDEDNDPPAVRLQITDNQVVIENGFLEVTIENPSGVLLGIKYKGINNVLEKRNKKSNRGYWDVFWNHGVDCLRAKQVNVITKTADLVEISFTKTWNSTTDNGKRVPLNIDKRYIVRLGISGFYMYGIFERQEDFPNANMDHLRIVFKLSQDKFRFMVLSDTRQRTMHSGGEYLPLGYKEAHLWTNPSDPQLRGLVDDKYQYASESKDNKLHGWISDVDAVGFWIITPSYEFRNGGPYKQGLTSHPGSTALSIFTSTHYAGKDFNTTFKKGEHWKKVFGPVLIYLNSASVQDDYHKILWNDAKRQLREEIASWPYNFAASEDFPRAEQRGEVHGRLLVQDRYTGKELQEAQSAFVGLAAPGYAGSWQKDVGKGYQFWTQTDKYGRFNIKNVRPGEYNLYALVPDFIGDYKSDLNITIKPGDSINLGDLIYNPPRNGPTLWEIGIPDRTASEFFIPEPDPIFVNSLCLDDADKYRQYGLWNRYSEIFRHGDLVYTVGTSNYSKDWFFAHVPRVGYGTILPTTWQIKYNLEDVNESGNYTLQLALASASLSKLEVRFNDPNKVKADFSTKRIGYDNAVARHGIHGLYRLYSISVPSVKLQKGNNTIYLSQIEGKSVFNAVMYDYIRLEGPSV